MVANNFFNEREPKRRFLGRKTNMNSDFKSTLGLTTRSFGGSWKKVCVDYIHPCVSICIHRDHSLWVLAITERSKQPWRQIYWGRRHKLTQTTRVHLDHHGLKWCWTLAIKFDPQSLLLELSHGLRLQRPLFWWTINGKSCETYIHLSNRNTEGSLCWGSYLRVLLLFQHMITRRPSITTLYLGYGELRCLST